MKKDSCLSVKHMSPVTTCSCREYFLYTENPNHAVHDVAGDTVTALFISLWQTRDALRYRGDAFSLLLVCAFVRLVCHGCSGIDTSIARRIGDRSPFRLCCTSAICCSNLFIHPLNMCKILILCRSLCSNLPFLVSLSLGPIFFILRAALQLWGWCVNFTKRRGSVGVSSPCGPDLCEFPKRNFRTCTMPR